MAKEKLVPHSRKKAGGTSVTPKPSPEEITRRMHDYTSRVPAGPLDRTDVKKPDHRNDSLF